MRLFAALLAAALVAGAIVTTPAESAGVSATVTIDAGTAALGAPLSDTAAGINAAFWDGHLQDPETPGLIRDLGVSIVRIPGGSTSDTYHWKSNTVSLGSGEGVVPGNSFDRVMRHTLIPAGTQTMITVNYGSNARGTGGGSPKEAAAWVRHANHTHKYGVKYWEIGNEIYGNGYYGARWEFDRHKDRSPKAYATNALTFIRLMKKEDRSIKIGLVLTAPGNWPDGLGPMQWNPTVLKIAGRKADFVSVHWYPQEPGHESDAQLLASPAKIPDMVMRLRAELKRYCGAHGERMGIMVTETNSVSSNPGKQTTGIVNAVFLTQDYLEWLRAGVQNVDWWVLHNGAATNGNTSPSLYGTTQYGDYGVLSNGDPLEPPANTPFPAYDALRLIAPYLKKGAHFAAATSSDSAVWAHGILQPDGSLAVVLANTRPDAAETVTTSIAGMTPSMATATLLQDAPVRLSGVDIRPQGGGFTATLPPYSVLAIRFPAL